MKLAEISNRYNFLNHIVFFYMIWAFSEVILYPFLREKDVIFCDLFGAIWKTSVWLGPVIAILKAGQNEVFVYLKLGCGKRAAMLWGALGVSFIAGYDILMHVLFYANWVFSPWLTFSQWLNTVFIAGTVEEILFRGYFLQKVEERFSFWTSNVLVSLLFVSIHFPIWFVNADKIADNAVGYNL